MTSTRWPTAAYRDPKFPSLADYPNDGKGCAWPRWRVSTGVSAQICEKSIASNLRLPSSRVLMAACTRDQDLALLH